MVQMSRICKKMAENVTNESRGLIKREAVRRFRTNSSEKNFVRPCATSKYALKHVVTRKAELKKPTSEVFFAERQSALKKQTKQA